MDDPFVPAPSGAGLGAYGTRNVRSVGRTPVHSRQVDPRVPEVGERARARSRARASVGAGTTRSGSSISLVAEQQHVDVERARPPPLAPDPLGLGFEALADLRAAPAAVSVVSTATTAFR